MARLRAGNTNVVVKVNGFSGGTAPQLQINPAGTMIEIVLIGKAAQSLRWHLDLQVRRST